MLGLKGLKYLLDIFNILFQGFRVNQDVVQVRDIEDI
jgi:hypothetical protein